MQYSEKKQKVLTNNDKKETTPHSTRNSNIEGLLES